MDVFLFLKINCLYSAFNSFIDQLVKCLIPQHGHVVVQILIYSSTQSSSVMKVFKTFTLICKYQYNARNGYKKAKNLMFTVCTKNWTLILWFVDGNSIKHMFPACDVCYPTNWQTQNRRCFIWADQQGCTICGVGQSRVALTRPHTLLATDLWWPWKGGSSWMTRTKIFTHWPSLICCILGILGSQVCYSYASTQSETLILTFKPNDKVLYTSRQTQRLNGEKHCLAYLTPWACWGRFCPPWGLQLCSLHAVLSLHLNLCFWQLLLNLHQLQLRKH